MAMERNVAIVGWKQTKHSANYGASRERMAFELVKSLLADLKITKDDVDTFVLCCNDFQDGRTISEVYPVAWIGAYMKDQTKVDADGSDAVLYALMRILSGNYDTALVIGWAMGGSEFRNQSIMNYTLDPIYERQLGLMNELSIAALQAKAYMLKYGLSEKQLAAYAEKNLKNAAKNPCALRQMADATPDKVLQSKPLYLPLRELHGYPATDGACAIFLAAEEKARKLTNKPVWIRGAASCQDTYYFGDRDLVKVESLRKAAGRAYKMAGIKDPSKEVSVAEVHSTFVSQEPIFAEALGLFPAGSGAKVIDEGLSKIGGKICVNASGGPQSANPFTVTGLIRVAEASSQVAGKAGEHQHPGAKLAVAHGQTGICGQHNTVFVLSSD